MSHMFNPCLPEPPDDTTRVHSIGKPGWAPEPFQHPFSHCPHQLKVRLRWLGTSIDTLLERYPRLKAAFLDSVDTEYGPTQYSVCIKVWGKRLKWSK